jgi:hypothetical protein
VARWLAGLLGLLSLLLVAAWIVLMLRFAETYVYPVQSITWLTRLSLLVVPLALGVVGLGIVSLRRGSWSLAWRLHYAIVMLAAVGLVGWLAFWNFLEIMG